MWHTFHRCLFICLSLTFANALLVFRKGSAAADSVVKPNSLILGEHEGLLGVRKAPPLVPRAGSSSFKVLQLADLHLGEDFDGDWGPRQDQKTMAVVEALLDSERPDLVVFSGDQVTGEDLRENASRREMLLNKLEEPLKKRGVPWATIFGNHDACDTPGCRTGTGNSRSMLLLSGKHEAPTQAEVDIAHQDLLDSMKKNLKDVIIMPTEAASAAPAPAGMSVAMAAPASAPPPPESIAVAAPAVAPSEDLAVPDVVPDLPAVTATAAPDVVATPAPAEPAPAEPAAEPTGDHACTEDNPCTPDGPATPSPTEDLAVPDVVPDLPAVTATAAPDVVTTPAPAEPAPASSTGDTACTEDNPCTPDGPATPSPTEDNSDQFTVLHALQPRAFLHAGSQASPSDNLAGAVRNGPAPGNGWREKYLQHEYASSLSRTGVDGMFESSGGGKSNYCLKIFDSSEDAKVDRPSFLLWFIDTGGGGLSEDLHADQLDWLSRESAAMEARYGPLPGALYAHIPLQEFGQVEPGQQSQSCTGVSDDLVTPVRAGASLFPLLSKMHISWVFSGHNHGNDWCCRVGLASSSAGAALKQPDIELCYGRHSGYGGYSTPGLHLRGARVFELHPDMAKRFLRGQGSDSGVQSWVRLEDGSKGPHWSEKP